MLVYIAATLISLPVGSLVRKTEHRCSERY